MRLVSLFFGLTGAFRTVQPQRTLKRTINTSSNILAGAAARMRLADVLKIMPTKVFARYCTDTFIEERVLSYKQCVTSLSDSTATLASYTYLGG